MLHNSYTISRGMRYSQKIVLRGDYKKKDGTRALSLRVSIDGKRRDLPIRLSVKDVDFNKESGYIKDSHPHARDFNLIIDEARKRATNIFVEGRLSNRHLSRDSFEIEFFNPQARQNFIEFYKSELIGRKNRIERGTYVQHSSTLNKLIRFKASVSFNQLTPDFLEHYEEYLKKVLKNDTNTVWRDMKNIRTYIRRAQQKDIRFEDPFRYYRAPRFQSEPCFLFPDEFATLVKYYNENKDNRTLRAFLFCCHTGLRMSDIQCITGQSIVDDELVFIPVKTKKKKKELRLPLTEEARRYLVPNGDLLFDIPAEQVMNRNLKRIAIRLGIIKKKFSFHAARHTFGFLYIYNGGDILSLNKLLGHEKISTTMTYVHLADDFRMRHQARSIIDKFNQ